MAQLDYESVLMGLPDAVVGVDEALRVILWNPAAEALTGRSARRVGGRALKEVLPLDSSLARHLTETLRTGESRSEGEAVLEGPDGHPIAVSIVSAPLAGRSSAVQGAVAVVRDLSRIRQLEEEVRWGERLAALGRMAVSVAHEIRNPIGAIRVAVQVLKKELSAEAQWAEYTEVLVAEVDRVNRILEQLLALGRPVRLEPRPLNLHQILERVTLLSQELAAGSNVVILRRYDPSLPPILGDEDRLAQVFTNLVRNAIEAMPAGGRLTVTTRLSANPLFTKVDLGGGARSMVEVRVADEGEGIAESIRGRIFEPFFTTKERGMGLGLALCHRIMEEHTGAIQVESVPGHGTTLSCFLPIAR
ncbi:MAG: nitrogen regulation protein NR(II) [Candidatus Methylomirabilia bacterium]